MIENIQIQTTSYCNAKCICCPYPEMNVVNQIKHGHMDPLLFEKIIKDCKKSKVKRIIPYLMNEPLMDRHIVERLKTIRDIYPDCFIELCTNASLLKNGLAKAIAPIKIDEFRISVIGDDTRKTMGIKFNDILKNVEHFREIKNPETNIKIVVLVNGSYAHWESRGYEVLSWGLTTRAGNVLQKLARKRKGGCVHNRHTQWLHVMWDGEVVLCCMDWTRAVMLGNLRDQNIKKIIKSKQYKETVNKIEKPKKDDNFLCSYCEWSQ